MIHATLYADLPAERIASLSLYELPYELAGHQYGVKANQKARPRAPAAAAESPQPGLHPGGLRVSGPTARRPPTAADRRPQVRLIFETDPELRFSSVDWKTAEDAGALALAACLLAETHGRTRPPRPR